MAKIIGKSEKSILFLCAIAIAICLYFLNNLELFSAADGLGDHKGNIGKINNIKVDVRQKFKKDYSWQKTIANSSLSEGDSLYTGPKSSCEITLAGGKKIIIAENSLIHFSKKNKQLSIDLAFGKVFATGLATEVNVVDCGQSYKIEPTSAEFELSKKSTCGTMNVDIKSGEVKINSHSLDATKSLSKVKPKLKQAQVSFLPDRDAIKKQEIFKFLKDLEKPIEAITLPPLPLLPPVVLETPDFLNKNFKVILKKDSKVELRWSSQPLAKLYALEISESSDFKNPTTIQVPEAHYTFKPQKDGLIFFRLKALNGDGVESSYSTLAKAELTYPSIELEQKKIQTQYQARHSKDFGIKKSFPIHWTTIESADKYVIEVDHNSNFSNPARMTSRSPAGVIELPQTGEYRYRVLAFNKQGRRISSTKDPGQISYRRIFSAAAPIIDATLKSISYYFQKEFGQFVWLRWHKASSDLVNLKYRIQISNSSEFAKINYDHVTKDNKFLMNKKLSQGSYFWRVRSENTQQYSDWSDIGTIKIQTKPTH